MRRALNTIAQFSPNLLATDDYSVLLEIDLHIYLRLRCLNCPAPLCIISL